MFFQFILFDDTPTVTPLNVLQCTVVCCSFWMVTLLSRIYSIMCCSVLQCVAGCCSVLQCVAVFVNVNSTVTPLLYPLSQLPLTFSILCCSVLQCVAVCFANFG